jgi:hypothetical protein
MTQEEQDAILGRTRREYKESKNRLGALKKLNTEIATVARKLADAIEHHPDRLMVGALPQGSLARTLADPAYNYSPEDATLLSPESLSAHLDQYLKVKSRKDHLRRELIEQGDDDPEAQALILRPPKRIRFHIKQSRLDHSRTRVSPILPCAVLKELLRFLKEWVAGHQGSFPVIYICKELCHSGIVCVEVCHVKYPTPGLAIFPSRF